MARMITPGKRPHRPSLFGLMTVVIRHLHASPIPLVWIVAAPCPLSAQSGMGVTLGAGVAGVFMVGQGVDVQDSGVGAVGSLELRPTGWHGAGLTVEGGWVPLETDQGSPGEEARNTLVHALVGPSWRPVIGPIRPEVALLAGVISSRWSLRSSGAPEDGSGSTAVWGGLAGLGMDLGGGRHPVTLRLQGRILDPGVLPFGRAPLSSSPQGIPGVARWDVALLSVALGLTVAL